MTPVVNKRKYPVPSELCQAISYQADENVPLGGKILVDPEVCNDCGTCVQACCGQAIEIQL